MRAYFIVGLILAIPINTQASTQTHIDECTCLWRGSFSEVATHTDLIVLGEITQVKGNAVDIRLEKLLFGDTWKTDLRVWMKTRDYCRPEADTFPVGSRWIMAINQIDEAPKNGFDPSTPNYSYGRKFDYILSGCGGYFLRVQGNTIVGNLLPSMPRWEYHPNMTPVLIHLIEGYLSGTVELTTLVEASKRDPLVKKLILNTKSLLRGQTQYLEGD